MADDVIERLVVGIGFQVDRNSARAALKAYTDVSAAMGGAIVASTAFAVAMAAQQDDAIKTARALGMTVEEYTRLGFVFDRNGVSADGMRLAVRTLQRQLLQAADGSAESVRAFSDLGVAIRDDVTGNLRTAAETMPDIVEALRTMPDRGRAAGLALVLLGRSGDKMATLIQGGAAGMEALSKRADDLGITLSTGAGEAAERLTDAVTDLRGMSAGFARTLANELIPPTTTLVESIVEWGVANRAVIGTRIETWGRMWGAVLESLATDQGRVAAGAIALGAAVGGAQFLGQFPMAGRALAGLRAGGPAIVVALAAAAAIDEIRVAAEGGETAVDLLIGPDAVDEWRTFARAAVDASGEIAGALGPLAESSLRPITRAVGDLSEAIGDLFGIEAPGWVSFFETMAALAERTGRGASNVRRGSELTGGTFPRLAVGGLAAEVGEATGLDFLRDAGTQLQDDAVQREIRRQRAIRQSAMLQSEIAASRVDSRTEQIAGAVELGIPVSVTVNAGPSREQIAEAAAQEVRRAVLQSDTIEGL